MFRGSPRPARQLLADAVCAVAVQFEANVAIRIRAEMGSVTVVRHIRVPARGDAVALRGRQGARSGGVPHRPFMDVVGLAVAIKAPNAVRAIIVIINWCISLSF
jgi:hypothetical protein